MTICAPNPFGCCGGSRLLKGGYSYWPLWWYGQRDELPDMSGHGVTLYPNPNGAYFDGQGYYFDGNDYLADAGGRKVLDENTKGSWHSVYLTEGAVPAKGSIWGTGTLLGLNNAGVSPKITGKIVLYPAYCPNLTHLRCYQNDISVLNVSAMTSLTYLRCFDNNLSALDVSALTQLTYINCGINNISVLDVSALTLLTTLGCYANNISVLDVSALTLLTLLYCFSNNISLLDVSALTLLKNLRCENNSMDQEKVDAVLCALKDHTETENGTLNISGNAKPSQDGEDCKYILVHDLGWQVTTD